MMTDRDRRRTAYHEGGHAVVGMLSEGADPVRKISIIPRGHALGVTFQSPDADQYSYAEPYLRGRIVGALGGMAAEQVVYGDVSTGAESDIQQLTGIARQMSNSETSVPSASRLSLAFCSAAIRRLCSTHSKRSYRNLPSTTVKRRATRHQNLWLSFLPAARWWGLAGRPLLIRGPGFS